MYWLHFYQKVLDEESDEGKVPQTLCGEDRVEQRPGVVARVRSKHALVGEIVVLERRVCLFPNKRHRESVLREREREREREKAFSLPLSLSLS